jgi:hypothetical protein
LDQLLDDTVEVDNTLHVEYGPESSNVACAAAEDEVNLVIGKFNNFLVLTLNNEHKSLFYDRYHSEWNSKSKRTNLISEKKHKKIVKVLLNFNKMLGIKPSYMYHWKKHHHILSNMESNCLYRKVVG